MLLPAPPCPHCTNDDHRLIEHLAFDVHKWTGVVTDHWHCHVCGRVWQVIGDEPKKTGRKGAGLC